ETPVATPELGQPTDRSPELLPDIQGVTVACDSNTLTIALQVPDGDSPGAVSRIAVGQDTMLFIADGGLYQAVRSSLASGFPVPLDPLLLPGQVIGGRPIQELVDLDVNSQSGLIAALDKAGHVFGYDPNTGESQLLFRASRALEERLFSAFQFVAVAFDT